MDLIRDIHPDTLAAISARAFHPAVLLFVDWPGDPVRVHSGVGTMNWGGHAWAGVGGLTQRLSLPEENVGQAMVEGSIVLGGTPEMIAAVLADSGVARGRAVQAWFAAVTERAGTTIIGAPIEAWRGTMGTARWQKDFDGEFKSIDVIRIELIAGRSQRSGGRALHSFADQQQVDPTDTFGRWLEATAAQSLQATAL